MRDIGDWFIASPTRGEASNTGAGEGQHSNSDFWGIMNGISGIAGDIATTANSLTGSNKGPKTPSVAVPSDSKKNFILVAGVVVVAVVAWIIFKRK